MDNYQSHYTLCFKAISTDDKIVEYKVPYGEEVKDIETARRIYYTNRYRGDLLNYFCIKNN